jgi:hypothetical protein
MLNKNFKHSESGFFTQGRKKYIPKNRKLSFNLPACAILVFSLAFIPINSQKTAAFGFGVAGSIVSGIETFNISEPEDNSTWHSLGLVYDSNINNTEHALQLSERVFIFKAERFAHSKCQSIHLII